VSTVETASEFQIPTKDEVAEGSGTSRRVGLATAGVGVGIAAGALAHSLSYSHGEEESSALRVTAHVTIPFLVAASVVTDRLGPDTAGVFRGGFLGAHLVHIAQIARLVRDHRSERLVRAELGGGTPLYGLVVLQAVLLTRPAQAKVGARKAERLTRRIDTQLLRVYCLATASGLARHRGPLPVYAGLASLLAGGVASRRRSH
jgi:hypothetical protein